MSRDSDYYLHPVDKPVRCVSCGKIQPTSTTGSEVGITCNRCVENQFRAQTLPFAEQGRDRRNILV